ncbi:hypothetical protein CC86DRAFT_295294 [Ophiobolus disseminans]|uniref:Uncharacterized protein n=1 Tax=Ophiobolus disseminans TaxID=1469910 RepID=A0A6A6ZY71_9PLEO|nr:hypothetical protein CC86DRAFT_295294 [Ophiobolus disseminans]
MQFQITTLTLSLLAALTTAAPSSLESRQGGYYNSVGYKYSGPGCNSQTLIFADPIFGSGGYCQALDRSGNGTPIVSYLTSSIADGCSGELSRC